ncbi:hypothetical protein LBMAG48_24010 [Phycisphaerae bacterium]|nr:hypothetical protein LBMAG48_24010 [Phycisphaerae bacterium]
MSNTPNSPYVPVLSVRPREAARITGIGVRLLWSQTAPRGPIPCVRIGKAVLYRLADLESFLAANAKGEHNG